MNIVILAAGQGKRMRSALPKVLHPVAGRAMLAHVLDAAEALAASLDVAGRITVVVGHGAEAVQAAVSDRGSVRTVLQQPQLGTGHAVMQAVPHLVADEPTLVLYGDVPLITSVTLRALLAAAGSDGVGLLTVNLPDPTGYGRIVRDWHGNVLKIVEQKDAHGDELAITEVNTGILVAPTARLTRWLAALKNDNAQQEYYLTDCIAQAVHDGVKVAGVVCADVDETLGVNSKAQLAQAERVVQRRIAERLMDAGATLADPARIDVRGELTVGADVFIDVGCVFEGRVHLADGARIGPYSVLRNITVGAGTEVIAFSFFEDSTIGAGARLGPFSRLRPGAQLGDEVHIGNFVEVKASAMGRGSKANHLAYVGDAQVGADCNIGAGTIVANYDGAHKHKTVLGDRVHTGSNSVLVAPIEVGAGATIGAGSTVSRAVPAGKLTVARARQTVIEGWSRPVKKK
ncbi:MAG: bifunctional UDP-N-acetylglucosamine diphosphorylase/glucosamine-1-phosphate N-acetyltransferase GlmU [Burkholderiaceae bacterium]|jgi:bifunctional UDP-N-acetylglucosamine pyrophosphorylase/glucosamine-1-phosphate N-acetyltransferase|nr:bifunctional UDP-N-acetylglucosamine diphosphorylase/glucosamine-1-phosphate N-acetyltransferase GlmU [Burkholderiaceae bacterium]